MPRKSTQTDFFKNDREYGPHLSAHGGSLAAGKRKVRRPFKRNRAMHVMLKSSLATEDLSLLGPKFRLPVDRLIEKYANRFSITIHAKQNVGNHLHLLVSAAAKERFQKFLRALASMIARLVTGAKKGSPIKQRFWDALAFTRLTYGPRDFRAMQKYIEKNRLEADFGALSRKTVELFEAAKRKARRTGRDIWDFL